MNIQQLITTRTRREDIECLILGRMGLSRQQIKQRTGLSDQQITLRFKRAGIKLSQYRNGETIFSQKLIRMAHEEAVVTTEELKQDIRKLLKK